MEVEYSKCRAAQFAKAIHTQNPNDELIHRCEGIELESVVDTLTDGNDIQNLEARIMIIGPEGFQKLPEQRLNKDGELEDIIENVVERPEEKPMRVIQETDDSDTDIDFEEF